MRALPLVFGLALCLTARAEEGVPKALVEGVSVQKFAGSDLIKHPTGATFTRDGKLLVIESHTHFRPKGYVGPKTDQIRWLEDSDGDGVGDASHVFFQADLVATMDIATEPSTGAIYVATRNEILRLEDSDGDGKADSDSVTRRLVYLETKGDYPHNGVSGLSFDPKGGLYFGIGENLGAAYVLRGSDGIEFADQGEGGNVWHCDRDGGGLRRVATGFWNPFGVYCDPDGNVFATDNDPGSSPPSRLHRVVEGGDYGYLYRYGRSGLHPFTSWDGQLTGHLPMLAGSGEAPCDIVGRNGHLLVASWADHRVDLFGLAKTPLGSGFDCQTRVLVQGGVDFRPVAFAEHPETKDLFLTDWVKADYNLHGEGAVWKIRGWKPVPRPPIKVERAQPADYLDESDSWRAHALLPEFLTSEKFKSVRLGDLDTGLARRNLLIAHLRNDPGDPYKILPEALGSSDAETRLLALKWIADSEIVAHRDAVVAMTIAPMTSLDYYGALTTMARLDGEKCDEASIQRTAAKQLQGEAVADSVKRAAFLVVPNRGKVLSLEVIQNIYAGTTDENLQIDLMLALLEQDGKKAQQAQAFARKLAVDGSVPIRIRPFAELAGGGGGVKLPENPPNYPELSDKLGWSEFTNPPSDVAQGDLDHGRIVFHRTCAICHRVLGFGEGGWPDLSTIGERGAEHILTSILYPSAEVVPQYGAWQIQLEGGESKMGFLLGQEGEHHTYQDMSGKRFEIINRDIVSRTKLPVSLMPPGLHQQMTADDLKALLVFLSGLRL